MKIQQHDGVVVDAGVTAAGLRRSTTRGRGVAGEREAPRLQGAAALPPPSLYRDPRGAPALEIGSPKGGGGQGGRSVPQGMWCAPPHPRVSTLGAGGRPKGGAPAH